ncbi:MAG: hypothetical protein ACK5OB_05140 [Pirellula sp.]
MRKRLLGLLTGFAIATSNIAYCDDGPTPTPAPELPGTILNGDGDPATGKIKCWISRHGDTATALTIFSVPGAPTMYGTLRRFKLFTSDEGVESMNSTPTEIDHDNNGTTNPITADIIPVKLVERSETGLPYKAYYMVYDANRAGLEIPNAVADFPVGSVGFKPGRSDRSGSGVVVRIKPRNPCDDPPPDDVGEEELITASTKYKTIPPSPLPSYSPQTTDPTP